MFTMNRGSGGPFDIPPVFSVLLQTGGKQLWENPKKNRKKNKFLHANTVQVCLADSATVRTREPWNIPPVFSVTSYHTLKHTSNVACTSSLESTWTCQGSELISCIMQSSSKSSSFSAEHNVFWTHIILELQIMSLKCRPSLSLSPFSLWSCQDRPIHGTNAFGCIYIGEKTLFFPLLLFHFRITMIIEVLLLVVLLGALLYRCINLFIKSKKYWCK